MHAIATKGTGHMYSSIVHAWYKYFCSTVDQRSRSQGQKQNFYFLFISEQIQINEQTFSNQTNTKLVSHDGHSTRAKQR